MDCRFLYFRYYTYNEIKKVKTMNIKINWQKVFNFIIGGAILSGVLGYLISFGINDVIQSLDKAEFERMIASPFKASLFSAFKLYIVTYILFGTLPENIKNASFFLRALYFTLFYIFCTLIYVAI